MQILHRFAGSIQYYFDEIADPDRYRPIIARNAKPNDL